MGASIGEVLVAAVLATVVCAQPYTRPYGPGTQGPSAKRGTAHGSGGVRRHYDKLP